MFCYLINFKFLSFDGLGGFSNSSLAIKKLWFWHLNECLQEEINQRKQTKYVGEKVSFGGLEESVGSSLATESLAFGS